jgi:hypothetical protein
VREGFRHVKEKKKKRDASWTRENEIGRLQEKGFMFVQLSQSIKRRKKEEGVGVKKED